MTVLRWLMSKKHFVLLLGAILAFGILAMGWMLRRADREMRESLLQQTRLVAQAIDLERLQALSGTDDDWDNPDYLRLKEQLAAAQRANEKYRFVYLMGRKPDGQVFFYADNEPVGSEDESPAGQIYKEASDDYLHAFETRTELVEGPVSDRWGVWISAMTPLIDPQTGDLIAMLGMDIDARDWKWEIAARTALPLGLMLVLLIGVGTFLIASQRTEASPKPVMRRLLPPLLTILVLLALGFALFQRMQLESRMRHRIATDLSMLSAEMDHAIQQQVLGLKMALSVITADRETQVNLHARNMDALLHQWRPFFETMQQEMQVTHLNFFDALRICRLRIHQPDRSGDLIDHLTARQAEKKGQTTHGIELGPLGTLILRVVQPIRRNGVLMGYIELGKQIEDVLQLLHEPSEIELAVLIQKNFLHREPWETGMTTLGRPADWDRLDDQVLIYTSFPGFPDEFLLGSTEISEIDPLLSDPTLFLDGRYWRNARFPFRNASGHVMGEIIIARDVTADRQTLKRETTLAYLFGGVILTLLLGYLYVLLRRTDSGIQKQQSLLAESEERLNATLHSIGDAVISTDVEGRVVDMNTVAESLTGWTLNEAQGQPLQSIFHIVNSRTGEPIDNPVEHVLSTGNPIELANHIMLIARDGSERQIADSAAPIRDAKGTVQGVVLVFRDVTEDYRIRQELRRSEEHYRSIVEGSPNCVKLFDAQGRYLSINQSGLEAMGWKEEDVIGRQFVEVWPEAIQPEVQDAVTQVLSGNRSSFEADCIRPDGRPVTWWVVLNPIHQQDGVVRNFIGISVDITERKKAEEKLLHSEIRVRSILESLPEGIIAADLETRRFVFVNESMSQMLGYHQDQLVGLSIEDIHPAEDLPRVVKEFEGALRGESRHIPELPVKRKDGSVFWAEIHNSFVEIDGRPALLAVFTDITERIQTVEALRASESRMRIITESAKDAIVMIDPSGNVEFWNPAAESIFGYTSEEALGKNLHQILAPARYHDAYLAAFEKFSQTGQGAAVGKTMDMEGLRKDGREVPVELSLSALPLDDGWHAIGLMRDITERKQAEEKLARSREQFMLAVRGTNDGIWDWDLRNNSLFLSPRWKEMLGYQDEELPNLFKTFENNIHPEDKPAIFDYLDKYLKGEFQDYNIEFRMQHKDGSYRWILARGQAVRDEKGLPYRMAGSHTDITERKQNEIELARSKQNLEEINEALKESTLRANDMAIQAQAASIAKSQFLANMSHEIRTPMNGVIGMTGLLLDTNLTSEQRHFAEIVRTSGNALLDLINDILDFSKIEADRLELEELDFNLRTALEEYAELLAIRAQEKNLEFVCAIDPDVPTFLQGDPGRLRQVLINLTGNAIKFTEQGEVTVRVNLESETDREVALRFSIRDTGVGIPEEKINLLFNAFQQVDASTTRKYGGTGLGLAISKRLIELMGGQVHVESKEGEGSNFWFTVPLRKQDGPAQQQKEPPRLAPLEEAHMLIVDDNETNREVLGLMLETWGVRYEEAESGKNALQLLRQAQKAGDPFQLAILDMQMPGMSGEDLGRTIQEIPELNPLPLVMMTSIGQRGDAARLQEVGFSAYLTKPVKQSELHQCLSTVLGIVESDDQEIMESEHKPQQDDLVSPSPKRMVTRHSIREDQRARYRILLVEDNVVNQKVALKILEKLGYRADAVADGAEAVKAVEIGRYHLVLMDVQMPVMDGFEATQAIRKAEEADQLAGKPASHLPIIAMTAHAMKGDRERCLEQGMDDYISKPVKPDTLLKILEKWLPSIPELPKHHEPKPAQAAVQITGPVWDRALLLERLMNDESLLEEIIDTALEDIPQHIERLKSTLENQDIATAERIAHSIKGAAANLAAEALRSVALGMEQAAKHGDSQAVAELFPVLEEQYERLKQTMTGKEH